jgi:hypothetical protein
MLKHLFVGAVLVSSAAFAGSGYHSEQAGAPTLPPAGRAMMPGPMPGPASSARGDDRFDAMRAAQLLNAFESAAARRDRREMNAVDARFQRFIDQELTEARCELGQSRPGRHGRGKGWGKSADARRDVAQLENLQREFAHLFGRVDRRAVSQKRSLYQQAQTLARGEIFENGHRRG